MSETLPAFESLVADYRNTAECNDQLFARLTAAAWVNPTLAGHRRHVEEQNLGFGDPAFHALWHSLLAAAVRRFGAINALEIGVFKGQVVSLWTLLAREHGWPVKVHGITPFAGDPLPVAGWWRSLRLRIDRKFRERVQSGDFYESEDYETVVRRHFAHHGLRFDDVRWIRGMSDQPAVLEAVGADRFHVIYIDGSHTFEGVSADLANFAPKVQPGGWLVMDDAGFDLPGTTFWKGYESVATACRVLPSLGFKNVLNVGHNRVYEKVS